MKKITPVVFLVVIFSVIVIIIKNEAGLEKLVEEHGGVVSTATTPIEAMNTQVAEIKSEASASDSTNAYFKEEDFYAVSSFIEIKKESSTISKRCFLRPNEIREKMYEAGMTVDDLSERQLAILELYDAECEKWYSYYDALLNSEKQEIDIEIEATKDIAENFGYGSVYSYDKKKINDAGVFISNNDSSDIGLMTLMYLLSVDHNFLAEIGLSLGTSHYQFLTQQSYYISVLYQCRKHPYACSSSSSQMLKLCVKDERYCGMNYAMVIAREFTEYQYSDISHAVDIIIRLVDEGFYN